MEVLVVRRLQGRARMGNGCFYISKGYLEQRKQTGPKIISEAHEFEILLYSEQSSLTNWYPLDPMILNDVSSRLNHGQSSLMMVNYV